MFFLMHHFIRNTKPQFLKYASQVSYLPSKNIFALWKRTKSQPLVVNVRTRTNNPYNLNNISKSHTPSSGNTAFRTGTNKEYAVHMTRIRFMTLFRIKKSVS